VLNVLKAWKSGAHRIIEVFSQIPGHRNNFLWDVKFKRFLVEVIYLMVSNKTSHVFG